MILADLPDEEEMRLLELNAYDVSGNGAEEDFNEISELAVQIFTCPIALVTLIDSTRQWFKGKSGTEETGNSRELSFCSHTILQEEVMVVEDAAKDDRFFDNPAVAGDFKIRFYAGAPVISPAGYKLGTVCLFDVKPRVLSEPDKKMLTLLAKQASRLLELRKKNVIIRQRAEDIITLKSKMIGKVMQAQEDDKKSIVYNLHEDLAQRIASGMMYMKIAEDSATMRPDLMRTAIMQLNEVLVRIRSLAESMLPQAINMLPAESLISEYIEKISPAFNFKITISAAGSTNNSYSNIAVHAIRIIEQWLKILSQKKVTTVHISIIIKEQFELLFEDDEPDAVLKKRNAEVFESMIYDRINSMNGQVELLTHPGKQTLKLSLPLVE